MSHQVVQHCERHAEVYALTGWATAVTFLGQVTSILQLVGLLISATAAAVNAWSIINRERRERKARKKTPRV